MQVGQSAARSVIKAIEICRIDQPRVLDLGCGPARVIRHLPGTWELVGADEYADSVEWSRAHVTRARFVQVDLSSRLPFDDGSFSVVISISLLPGVDPHKRKNVAAEAARVLQDGGLLIVSTPGAAVLRAFDAHASPDALNRGGVLRSAGGPFLFTALGLDALFGEYFEPVLWEERGLDGFQDLSVYRKKRVQVPG